MALIFIFMGLSVHSIADFDKFNLEFNEIQQFISNWNSNYRLKANEINILVGLPISEKTSTGSTVITLDQYTTLKTKHTDDLNKIYPYTKQLDLYEPLSFEDP